MAFGFDKHAHTDTVKSKKFISEQNAERKTLNIKVHFQKTENNQGLLEQVSRFPPAWTPARAPAKEQCAHQPQHGKACSHLLEKT